ncbi:MAG: hypothetical protein H6Q89_5681 [Myxococcaceae bacterium]|nr:hypothetical protein [Myxococcaceae bacterium]
MNFFKLTALLASFSLLTACGIDDTQVTESDVLDSSQDELIAKGRFETFTGRDGKTYFHLLAGNGEKVLASQGYTTLASAEAGIASVKTNGVLAERFEQRTAVDGSTYFVVKAGNGAVIGVSQMYSTVSNTTRAQNAVIAVLKISFAQAPVVIGARFETFKGLDSKYYFHARAGNGEIVLQSQAYTTSTSSKNGVASVQTNGSISARYEVREASNGQYYFVLKAANGAVIARGETYASKYNAERGIATCVDLLTGVVSR